MFMRQKVNYFVKGLIFLALFIIVDVVLSHLAMASGSFKNGLLLRDGLKIGLVVVSMIFFVYSAFRDKKLALRIISICLLILLSYWLVDKLIFLHKVALSGTGATESSVAEETKFVDDFMKARLEKNEPLAESFLTDNAKKQYSSGKLTLVGLSNPHFADFKILETKKLDATQFRFKVRIDEEYTGQGKTGYFDETLTVIRKGDKYLIDSVERGEYINLVLKTFSNPIYKVAFNYPSSWQLDLDYKDPQLGEKYAGEDGFFQISAISGVGLSIDEVYTTEAYHKLHPYGSCPKIEKLKIQNQEARLILPSTDQPAEEKNRASLVIKYPQAVQISGDTYNYFVLWADQNHIREIAKTLKFTIEPVGKITHGPHPYFNKDYGFTLISDPNQSNPYTDFPDLCSFQVIPLIKNCGDITKSCPPATIIPGFRWYPASKRPPLPLTQKITFPGNPVPFCFVKGIPEYGAGSIYEHYYYITTTKDNRCFAMHFVIHKANCAMFGIKEQIDECAQSEDKKDQIPDEYVKTFRFVDPVHIYELKLTACKAIPNNSTQKIVETTRLFINLPKDIYPDEEHNFKFSTVSGNARAGRLDNCGSPGTGCQSTSECWSYYCQFDGNGEVDLHVKSAIKGMPDYFVRFIVSSTPN